MTPVEVADDVFAALPDIDTVCAVLGEALVVNHALKNVFQSTSSCP